MTGVDAASVLVDGPWTHRFVAAHGARFHVAQAGEGPLVVLLHGFPQTWWAWRAQVPALVAAGFRVAAMDLRGSGASDKPPQGYDVPTLAADVAGVIRSLGCEHAVVVGHGLGAAVAWSMPALHPSQTRAVAALGCPHPADLHTGRVLRSLLLRPVARHIAWMQLPWFPERALVRGDLAARLMREWGADGAPDAETVAVYRSSMQIPFAAHSAMEVVRWLVRSTPRVDGRRYLAAVGRRIEVPVLQVHGGLDRCVPASVAATNRVAGPYRFEVLAGAGHFLPEEAPEQVSELLVEWLRAL